MTEINKLKVSIRKLEKQYQAEIDCKEKKRLMNLLVFYIAKLNALTSENVWQQERAYSLSNFYTANKKALRSIERDRNYQCYFIKNFNACATRR